MFESKNAYWSDVDNFSLHSNSAEISINIRTDKKGEHAHIANVQPNAKIKLQLGNT